MKSKKQTVRGLVLCFTGNGKGKTTAAMGLVLRAIGHRKKVLIVQFMKTMPSAEIAVLKRFPGQVTIKRFGAGYCWCRTGTSHREEHRRAAAQGITFINATFSLKKCPYDVVVLDEICVAEKLALVRIADVLRLISLRPKAMHLVLTGRYAHPKIRACADLVSDIRDVKHPYKKGVREQAVIEY